MYLQGPMWDKKINEAMSIADSVTAVATDIGNDLIDDMNNTIEGKYFDGGVERNGSFFYNKNGLKVAVKWTYYKYYKSPSDAVKSQYTGETSMDENYIKFVFHLYNGKLNYKEFYDTIQHEVTHYYEQMVWGRRFVKGDKNYEKALENAKSADSTDIDRYVALIIYTKSYFEQRAYLNGAYRYMMDSDDYSSKFENSMKETSLYKLYESIKNARITIINYVKLYNKRNFKERFLTKKGYKNIETYDLVRMAKRAENGLLYALGRARIKAISDYRMEHGVLENTGIFLQEYKQPKIDLSIYIVD